MVSVILAAYHSHPTLAVTLEALAGQTFRDFETIVVDSSPDPRPAATVAERFPDVRFHHHPHRLLPHEARNVGATMAVGDVMVFSDPDCRADPGWLEHLIRAQRQGHEAVGGPVACLGGSRNQAIHMSKYGWWLPGGAAGTRLQIPSANSSFSRALWEKVGPYRGQHMSGDTLLCWRIQEAGYDVWFEPKALVTHLDHGSLWPFLKTQAARGWDFGRMRAEHRGWTGRDAASRLVATPLVPFVMLGRTGRYAADAGHAGTWAATVPIQLLATVAWALGEARFNWGLVWQRSPGS